MAESTAKSKTDKNYHSGDDGASVDGSGGEDYDVQPTRFAQDLREKRCAQKAILDSWIESSAGQDAIKRKDRSYRATGHSSDEQSIHAVLAQQQNGSQIVKNPRDYQIELFERAKKENTIAVLDTGSGKTLIAVLLLRWIIDEEIERRAREESHKISFFLVNSVTLLFQQFSVLECNLDHKVARVCGADGVHCWNREHWRRLHRDNKVVICTAEILFQALSRSFITMQQINLLIYDEAHHTKKNHAYARIIKDFYLAEQVPNRPRVFGMTASPIDAKDDVIQAASELETLLDCKIATTSDMSLSSVVKNMRESIMKYATLPSKGFETQLLHKFKVRYEHIEVFQKSFNRATEIARHLGRWCADAFLIFEAFSVEKVKKYEMKIERKFHAHGGSRNVQELDAAIQEVHEAVDWLHHESSAPPAVLNVYDDLSSKVLDLHRYLNAQFERKTDHRCIVFVEARYTARLLHRLFQQIGTKFMHSHFLVGSNNESTIENSFSFREQVVTLFRFRKGELNCLFATSVAEEGLDVPDCNLVIRFDMYKTMIQYVQSRGRARMANSTFIHMLEQGNSAHDYALHEVRFAETVMRDFCNMLPDDRKLHGNEDTLGLLLAKEKMLRTYEEPTTGAKLTYGNALTILANFVSAIPTDHCEPQHPTYVVSSQGARFIAEVILPGNAPMRAMVGSTHSKRMLAKRSAAFDACIQLRKKNFLDGNFLPTYHKKLPALRNALLAVTKNTTGYDMRVKPSIWEKHKGTLPTELFITIVDFSCGLDRPHQPLALLTKTCMPQFPSFPIFLNDGRATSVVSETLRTPISVTAHELEKLSAFTFRLFRDVFSKIYEEDVTKLSYWLAPAKQGRCLARLNERVDDFDSGGILDWSLLREVHATDAYQWTPETSDEFLRHRFVVDIWDGSRKFYFKHVDPKRSATDPIPEGTAKSKLTGTILDYSVSLWKKSREIHDAQWLRTQPVVEAELILPRRNLLAPAAHQELDKSTKAFVCPQPLRISVLPPEIATSSFAWPAIIHRFESILVSIEGCTSIGVTVTPNFALAAFTKDSDNQGDSEQAESVNFQRGMGENYERLEFIGDTFLKTATTISVFIMNPNENEFEFHVRRMQMLCNKNLYETALQLRLYEFIRSKSFSRRTWYPEGMKLLSGRGVTKGHEKEMFHEAETHQLGEKTIADVCEALIGAVFVTNNELNNWTPNAWDDAVRTVSVLVNSPDHIMQKWDDYRTAYEKPQYQTEDTTAVQRYLAEKVETEHSYRFAYPRLLYSAFMHPSSPYILEKVPNYQRLEFLGDALLDMASINYLFYSHPDKDPQWLTEHKMAMVSNKFLGALCVNIGFHKHLRHYNSLLEHQIRDYATELHEAKRLAGDSRDYWTTVSDPPKCLPDIVEAYVGAMFIDSDFDYSQVQRFFDTHILWYFEDMKIYDAFANNHPCTHLHELFQTKLGCMDYRIMAKELPSEVEMDRKDVIAVVMVHDRIVAHSSGKSGKYAKLRAANIALGKLDGLGLPEFRAQFRCDCRAEGSEMRKLLPAELEHGMIGVDCGI